MLYFRFTDLHAYKSSRQLADAVWHEVMRWPNFAKFSMGDQFTRAVDSISANIAEGFGRYHKKDKIKFYNYSIGSVCEAEDWNSKAHIRGILTTETYVSFDALLRRLPSEIRALIRITNEKLKL